jgi:hypothetical protein
MSNISRNEILAKFRAAIWLRDAAMSNDTIEGLFDALVAVGVIDIRQKRCFGKRVV